MFQIKNLEVKYKNHPEKTVKHNAFFHEGPAKLKARLFLLGKLTLMAKKKLTTVLTE